MSTAKTDWTEEAARALKLCEKWAKETKKAIGGDFLIFGSTIYRDGEQFDPLTSDLDIVYIFPDNLPALKRTEKLKELKRHKSKLELAMIPILQRSVCDDAGVSIVPITKIEVDANIHKSGVRNFFTRNKFYSLEHKKQQLGLKNAGLKNIPDVNRHAIEYVQKLRNEYLSICANSTGGLKPYAGGEPLPKALMRTAAQLDLKAGEGEWYDTRLGLDYLFSLLYDVQEEDAAYKALFRKISIKRGGRGKKEYISGEEQILLAELLFDKSAECELSEMIIWSLENGDFVNADEKSITTEITKIIPDASTVSHGTKSPLVTIHSSKTSYDIVNLLNETNSLPKLWRFGNQTSIIKAGDVAHPKEQKSKLEIISNLITNWSASKSALAGKLETSLRDYLQSNIHKDSPLEGAQLIHNITYYPTLTRGSIHFDLGLLWDLENNSSDQIDIEVKRIRNPAQFYNLMDRIINFENNAILALVVDEDIHKLLKEDAERYELMRPNIKIIFPGIARK